MELAMPTFRVNEIIFAGSASVFLYFLGYLLFPDIHSSLGEAVALIALEAALGIELGLVAHQILTNDHKQ